MADQLERRPDQGRSKRRILVAQEIELGQPQGDGRVMAFLVMAVKSYQEALSRIVLYIPQAADYTRDAGRDERPHQGRKALRSDRMAAGGATGREHEEPGFGELELPQQLLGVERSRMPWRRRQ